MPGGRAGVVTTLHWMCGCVEDRKKLLKTEALMHPAPRYTCTSVSSCNH